jgi:hypothetical protein
MTNKEFSRTADFVKLCEAAKVKPTKRQASKFRMGKGDLFKVRNTCCVKEEKK